MQSVEGPMKPRKRGPKEKLSEAAQQAVFTAYGNPKLTAVEVAKTFAISRATVYKIVAKFRAAAAQEGAA